MRRTIDDLLADWPFDSEHLNARVVEFESGRAVLQIRIDMGLLQLEMEGRPDGLRPEGYPSWLDYHLAQLELYRQRQGSVDGFGLDADICGLLREEATLVYQRYVVLHHLGRFAEVARDTARNLRCADFLKRHAEDPAESWGIEQYRPYILMMNALSRAELYLAQHDYASAERVLSTAVATIRGFAAEHAGRTDCTRELQILGDRQRDLDRLRPRSDVELLQRQLDRAVAAEDYETAARLRDQIQQATGDLPKFWE